MKRQRGPANECDGGVDVFPSCDESCLRVQGGCAHQSANGDAADRCTRVSMGVGDSCYLPDGLVHQSRVPTTGTQRTICTFFAEEPIDEGDRVKLSLTPFSFITNHYRDSKWQCRMTLSPSSRTPVVHLRGERAPPTAGHGARFTSPVWGTSALPPAPPWLTSAGARWASTRISTATSGRSGSTLRPSPVRSLSGGATTAVLHAERQSRRS